VDPGVPPDPGRNRRGPEGGPDLIVRRPGGDTVVSCQVKTAATAAEPRRLHRNRPAGARYRGVISDVASVTPARPAPRGSSARGRLVIPVVPGATPRRAGRG